jgi:hypothetical protein
MESLYQIPSESCSNLERRAFWDKIIIDQSTSGLSLVKFCQLHQLKFTTFRSYKYKKTKAKAAICRSDNKDKSTARFVPLQIAADVSVNKYPKDEAVDNKVTEIKVTLKNGHKLILPLAISETSLLLIIKMVAEL